MKKYYFALLLTLFTLPFFAFSGTLAAQTLKPEIKETKNAVFENKNEDEEKNKRYAILQTTQDNVPIRQNGNENAKRLTHLYKNTILFAQEQTPDYYKVELNNKLYGFVNKKNVELRSVEPEKRIGTIKNISFKEEKKRYVIKIETDFLSAYKIEENQNDEDGKKELVFTLFDNNFNPNKTEQNLKNSIKLTEYKNFEIENSKDNEFSFKYIPVNQNLFGYGVETIQDNNGYIYFIKKPPKISLQKPLKNITVAIDPGHGGQELGACAFGAKEKDINLEISKKLKKELKKGGAKTYLTRTNDKTVKLYDRIDFAKRIAKNKGADILLSIHQNSLPNINDVEKKHGVGTYYYHNQAKPLAEAIQKELINATGFKDDKIHYASFALTRPSEFISVLVECGYIIHPYENKMLRDENFQKIIVKAIKNGVENYLRQNF